MAQSINTVIIYIVEAHPIDVPSPNTEGIWLTPLNEIAGIDCTQPRTLEERIELAEQLRCRFRFSIPMLIDALDDRAWRAFGSGPNVATLVQTGGRIAVKQGWFEAEEMRRAITALLKNPTGNADSRKSLRECEEPRFGGSVFLKEIRITALPLLTQLGQRSGRRPVQNRRAPRQGRRGAASSHRPRGREIGEIGVSFIISLFFTGLPQVIGERIPKLTSPDSHGALQRTRRGGYCHGLILHLPKHALTFDIPGAYNAAATGINTVGEICGCYYDRQGGGVHGLTAQLNE